MPAKIKICGLTGPGDVEAVNAAGADFAGFVLFEKSKRFVIPERAGELIRRLDPGIRSVAVCVSPGRELLKEIESTGFDIVQIHGEIPKELLEEIRIPVWQAVNLSGRDRLDTIIDHPRICGYVVDGAEYGSGKTFGWEGSPGEGEGGFPSPEEIRSRIDKKLFVLAGGLNPKNVRRGIRMFSPDAVDVSSGVESPGGMGDSGGKDEGLIFRFTDEVRREE